MFGKSQAGGISIPVPDTHTGIISEDEAIAIAKGHFRWPAFTKPVTAELSGTVWTVTVHEYHGIAYRGPEGSSCSAQPSGYILRINVVTGKILSTSPDISSMRRSASRRIFSMNPLYWSYLRT